MFIRIDPEEYEILKTVPGLERIAQQYDEAQQELVTYAKEIEQARQIYARPSDDDLEIDDKPVLSVGDDGLWVNAWVWIAFPEPEDVEETDDA